MATPRILVIGSTNTDMVVEVPALPGAGETVLGGAFRMTPGGKGANQAVAAARAGGEVTFVTAVGDDMFGEQSRRRFADEGIHTRYVFTRPGVPSGVALIMVDAHGENVIAVAPGANSRLTHEDLAASWEAFHGSPLILMQLEIPLESVRWAAGYAAGQACTVLLNPAPMPAEGLPDELLANIDILTPNEGELLALAPGAASLEEAAHAVLARGPRMVVVTQGRHGATAFTADGALHLPALTLNTVDTVGAGDCFSACLAVALAEGRPLPDAMRFAIVGAGLSTTLPGAQASMPSREAIELFLAAPNSCSVTHDIVP